MLCLSAATPSCLGRRRPIARAVNTKPLQITNLSTLLSTITKQYDAVRDFRATVEMVPATGSAENNNIIEYNHVIDRAYIQVRKPAHIHLTGRLALIRTKAFEMASDGTDFKFYIPSKSLFIVGRNDIEGHSPNKIENLRPQHFLDALMVRPIDTKLGKAMLGNVTDEDNAHYIVHEMRERADGAMQLLRMVWFSRLDLVMTRQMIFDEAANVISDARYSQWHTYDNVPFPKHIEIHWPRDQFAMILDLSKMDINKGVPDDQFLLDQPEGTTLRILDAASRETLD